jgi:succinoglycan biosynthesis protein ExoU
MDTYTGSVSVLIAAYNAAGTIRQAVASALAEPEVKECIVIDDASGDRTIDEAHSAAEGSPRLKILSLKENKGPAFARNVALDVCQGAYVCVLDADDFFIRGRLRRLLSLIGDADFLADDILIVPEAKATEAHIQEHQRVFEASREQFHALDLAAFVSGNIPDPRRPRAELGFLKPLIRRSFLAEHNLKYNERFRLGEDYALYVDALRAGARFHVVGPCGYVAVERTSSISSHHSSADLQGLEEFDSKCLATVNLSAAERVAFEKHLAVTRKKADYARALELRARNGVMAGILFSCSRASSVPYMVAETWRAKLRSAAQSLNMRRPERERQIRYLVGVGRS